VFDRAMNPVSSAAFTLTRADDSRRLRGTVVLFANRALVFKPSDPLPNRTRVIATITTAATTPLGGSLPTAKSWSFTTR
jgi:hypothetical protein